MEEKDRFKLTLNSSQLEKVVVLFKYKIQDEAAQNKFLEDLFIKQAKKQGFSDKEILGIKSIVSMVSFDIDKSTLLYKMKSQTILANKIEMAKNRINDYLEKEEAEKKKGQENGEREKRQIKDKPMTFKMKRDFLKKICLASEVEKHQLIYSEVKSQALSQGFSEDILHKQVGTTQFGVKPNISEHTIAPPRPLIDIMVEQVDKTISDLSKEFISKEEIKHIINDPANEKREDLKLLVLCHLKEANEKEFNELIQLPGMRGFLGEQTLKELIDARRKDSELDRGTAKPPKKKLEEEEEKKKEEIPTETDIFTDAEKEIAGLLGVDNLADFTPEELHKLAIESGIEKSINPPK